MKIINKTLTMLADTLARYILKELNKSAHYGTQVENTR